ncbi:MAG TPA: pyridoxal phosphate-dependent aminotransferase [Solirubrobacteraceae bacterium]|nr:pyridoxal phosphate-dependent aminotransferase [Solirubrobacteraceae bacterium]
MTENRHPFKQSRRATEVRGFGIDKTALAADAVRSDWPVLRMENLDTDLPLPPEAIPETIGALERPESNSWLPFTGDMDLRAAISDFTAERTGRRYDPASEVIVTSGGTSAILDVLLATVDPGDEVLLTDPTYAGIVNRVRVAGGIPRLVPYRVQEGEWRLDLDAFAQAAAARPAIAVLMSPSMPSGATLTPHEWDAVAAALIEHDVPLLYDAAMERLLFDDRPLVHPVTLPGMAERTVIVGSLSKEHRMIGWRVGWVAGPAELVESVGWMHVYNTTMPTALSRFPAAAVLRGDQGHVAGCVDELEARRDIILDALAGWPVIRPGGGWSLLIDAIALGTTPAELSQMLLADAAIAATPMLGWGGEVADRHVRLVFSAESRERLATIPERFAGTRLEAYGSSPRTART